MFYLSSRFLDRGRSASSVARFRSCILTVEKITSQWDLNGIGERANRKLVESAGAMLDDASLPRCFWTETISHAAYICILSLCPSDNTKNSYGLSHRAKPSADHLKLFGCLRYYHVSKSSGRILTRSPNWELSNMLREFTVKSAFNYGTQSYTH